MTKTISVPRELLEQAASMELDTTARSIRIQDELRAVLTQPAQHQRILAASVPAGCKVVPVEPTAGMLDVAVSHALMVSLSGDYNWSAYMRDVWLRMVAAAPSAPATVQGVNQQLLEAVTAAFEFVNKSGEHDSVCDVFDLDDDDQHKDCNCGLDAIIRTLYAAIAAAQEGGWIPVSERLPDVAQEVIVNSEFDGITAGFLDSYGEWYSPNSDYKLTRVVAWQPLPAPPAIAAARQEVKS